MVEERLSQKALVGTGAKGRLGLGYFPSCQISKAKRKGGTTSPRGRSACRCRGGMSQQGAWTRWENTLQWKVTWSDFWQADIYSFRFLVQAVYETLPSLANLQTWGKSETPACPLCAGRGCLQHLLSSCPKALADGCDC